MASEVDIEPIGISSELYTALDVSQGTPIAPLDRLKIMNADSWEDLTLELVHYWKTQYSNVVRCGGGGDMGRDVIAYTPNDAWENFQCKYYDHPLKLDEAITEIGKLIYYCHKREYIPPVRYYFVTPLGVTVQLLNHLMNNDKLKKALIDRWDKQCRIKITTTKKVPLEGDLLEYLNSFNFEMFDHIAQVKIIDLHSRTPFHAFKFGAVRRNRPKPNTPPNTPNSTELTYISELLAAFSDAENKLIDEKVLSNYPKYNDEYKSARRNFYSAENLEKFSRDWLPIDSYKELAEECYETITPVLLEEYDNAFRRYLKTSAQAVITNFSSHPLHFYIKPQDKKGICHYLVNEKRIKWTKL